MINISAEIICTPSFKNGLVLKASSAKPIKKDSAVANINPIITPLGIPSNGEKKIVNDVKDKRKRM